MREFEAAGLIVGAAEAHLVVGGVDARGMDIDDDIARAGDRIGRVTVSQRIEPAMLDEQHRLHRALRQIS